jgi:hypothetical protein
VFRPVLGGMRRVSSGFVRKPKTWTKRWHELAKWYSHFSRENKVANPCRWTIHLIWVKKQV